eukprot:6847728-Prymnesium_polylepis.2
MTIARSPAADESRLDTQLEARARRHGRRLVGRDGGALHLRRALGRRDYANRRRRIRHVLEPRDGTLVVQHEEAPLKGRVDRSLLVDPAREDYRQLLRRPARPLLHQRRRRTRAALWALRALAMTRRVARRV